MAAGGDALDSFSPRIGVPHVYADECDNLSITGGFAVKTQLRDKIVMMDPDPVPLEAVRGAYITDGIGTQEPFTADETDSGVNGMNAAWTNVPADPNDPSKGNLRDRVRASVIPVNSPIAPLALQVGEERHVW